MTKRGRASDDFMEEIVRSTAAKRAGGDPEVGTESKVEDEQDMAPPARAASPTCPGVAPHRCLTKDDRSAQMITP